MTLSYSPNTGLLAITAAAQIGHFSGLSFGQTGVGQTDSGCFLTGFSVSKPGQSTVDFDCSVSCVRSVTGSVGGLRNGVQLVIKLTNKIVIRQE